MCIFYEIRYCILTEKKPILGRSDTLYAHTQSHFTLYDSKHTNCLKVKQISTKVFSTIVDVVCLVTIKATQYFFYKVAFPLHKDGFKHALNSTQYAQSFTQPS